MTSRHPSTFNTICLISLLASSTHSMPLTHLSKRASQGLRAGVGIAIAVGSVMVLMIIIFLIIHFRRAAYVKAINRKHAILAGEKNTDGSLKYDKFAAVSTIEKAGEGGEGGGITEPAPTASIPRRNKSVKDRLMGPLYRGSAIDLMPMPPPNRARLGGQYGHGSGGGLGSNRSSTLTLETGPDGQPIRPWTNTYDNSPRASFSSKRATRMMMLM